MRTVRCSDRLRGECLPGRCLPERGCLPGGVPAWGLCLSDTIWTESQTSAKTLPCRNYVTDGNNIRFTVYILSTIVYKSVHSEGLLSERERENFL